MLDFPSLSSHKIPAQSLMIYFVSLPNHFTKLIFMRTRLFFISSTFLAFCLFACTQPASQSQTETSSTATAETSPVADAEGYVPLFDGKSTKGWRNFKKEGMGEQWVVTDGTLSLTGKGGGDIITEQQFDNFDLKLEWKIYPNGNSGLFFYVVEADSL